MEVLLKCMYSKNSDCLENKYVMLNHNYHVMIKCVFTYVYRDSILLVAMEKLISLFVERALYVNALLTRSYVI